MNMDAQFEQADGTEERAPETLFDILIDCTHKYRERTAFVYRSGEEEQQVSYGKVFEDVLLLARAFRHRGIGKGDKVVLLSDNRYAWFVTDLAIMALGAVDVPRGADTPTQELEFIVNHSGSTYLVAETVELFEYHHEFLKASKQLKGIFVMTGPAIHTFFSNTYSYTELLEDRRYTEKDVSRFLELGKSLAASDLLTLIYTSGTTGTPKGVQLSHENIMHNIRIIPGILGLSEEDTWLSILPTWHIFERTAEYSAFASGNSLIYSSVKTFAQDLESYRPTVVATVPRVWESLYSRVQAAVRKKGATPMRIFRALVWVSAAFRYNNRRYRRELPEYQQPSLVGLTMIKAVALVKMALLGLPYLLAQRKLAAVQLRFGGRLRLAISGGGTLAPYLEEWIDAIGIRIVNAYGMTECAPAIAGRGLNCEIFGTLGPPVPGTEVRIVTEDGEDIPIGGEGLIEVRGPQVTSGYYNNDEENRKSFSADGFFRTGDLGRLTVHGELAITGRAKEIIVLASGENIDPTRIENAISMFPFVQDAILVGQDKKGLAALVVPNIDELKEYVARKFSGLKKEQAELLTDGKVLESIKKDMNRLLLPKQGFKSYEKLHGIVLLDREFKLGEELTNTLKKKRHVIEKKYRQIINDLLH